MSRVPSELLTTAPTPPVVPKGASVRRLVIAYSPIESAIGSARLLGAESIVIGRAPPAPSGWPLDDAQASRAHVRIAVDGERVVLEDLGSRNGTFVAGVRAIGPCELAPGAAIRVGAHVLIHDVVPASAVEAATEPVAPSAEIVGQHPRTHEVLVHAARVAPLVEPVLLLGESGTGKELLAAHLHAHGGRAGPFVAVNSGSLPEALADAELFGHAKGAFTGASAAHAGLFVAADGGTLFLDEIGDAPPEIQIKLLRALATGEVRAVGETRARRVDVRVIAATNVDLDAAIAAGTFRRDLHARLAAHVIRMPALRERRTDVLPLAVRFLASDGEAVPSIPAALGPDAAEALLVAPFPGNVRELMQAMRATRLARRGSRPLELADLPDAIAAPIAARAEPRASASPGAAAALLAIRRDAVPEAHELRQVLAHFQGNVRRVAEFFGKDRKQIYRWAERLGVAIDDER